MAELHEQLMMKKKRWLEQDRLKRERETLQAELNELERKESHLNRKLSEEKEDVEALEKMSLANLFYTISGRKDEKVEQEKQEVIEAQLKWKEAKQSVQELSEDIQHIKERIHTLGNPGEEYEALWAERKQYLIQKGEEKGKEILKLADQQSYLEAELEEVEEAIAAGDSALYALREAEEALGSASNWGTLDMLGGGIISTAVKHSRIDDANDAVHRSQRHLRKFAAELEDIGQHVSSSVQVSGALTVADYFFDGLIVDWFVQNKIHDSQSEVESSRRKTQDALHKLNDLASQFKDERERVRGRINAIVETKSV
ncbi:hypothetical protein LCM20_03435 [Halobacillus litoralis]|uniref:hypothetical protein n=1 Tax=Halobacillus litoralis TaxID=45668 RepID=UPI001CD5CEB7|nr:hypothetical protein [Halobacillus litoralis]MCA0969645.1 hypothetical protein [Halobacillus litoralis]